MKTIDLASLDLVSGGGVPGVCTLTNLSGHPVMLHAEGQRIAMAPGDQTGLVDGERFSIPSSPRGRAPYTGRCSGGESLGIAKDGFAYTRKNTD
jgi:hypothetical protein